MDTATRAGCTDDASFGPTVQGCRGDFDLTVTFEHIFFSIVPSSIFIVLAVSRLIFLARRRRIASGVIFQYGKLEQFFCSVYAGLELVRLVRMTSSSDNDLVTRTLSVASSAVTFVAALLIIPLSSSEHERSPRPSAILCSYLLVTSLLDMAQVRTAWLSAHSSSHITSARIATATLVVKALPLLLLESRGKSRYVLWEDGTSKHSPEETAGLFSIGSFYWLNELFIRGYRSVLKMDGLYPLDQRMLSGRMYDRLSTQIASNPRHGDKYGLAKNLITALAWPLLLPVAPRICAIAFNFCQPFLFSALLDNLEKQRDDDDDDDGVRSASYGLIGATALTYLGIALSGSVYAYFTRRSLTMARGCLASVIYEKTTSNSIAMADDDGALTLMSVDVDTVLGGLGAIHDTWASTVEIAVGCWLLEKRLGAAFLSPVIVIATCAVIMSFVGMATGKKQTAWMEKIQSRVGLTSKVIGSMKQLKMAGMAEPVGRLIHALRIEELEIGNGFRWIQVIASTVAFAPQCLSQIFAFALTSKNLDVATMYESLSYLVLLTGPLANFFQVVPSIMGAFACVARIQTFLEAEPRVDYRHWPGTGGALTRGEKPSADPDVTRSVPLVDGTSPTKGETVVSIEDGHFGWVEGTPALRDINMSISAGQLTLVIGPVASGKSTLCKAILGEAPHAKGAVTFHFDVPSVAFCEQSPFLVNGSLKENITRHCQFDQKRYAEVIEATALAEDIALLPQGDETKIGSAGIALSGGQKCRVSLARALYQPSSLLVLDDILSGLDNNTESTVFRRVFGPQGLIRQRGVTAVLCTHSVRHLPEADHIIALGKDGTIVEQGPFESLSANQSYVQSLGVGAKEKATQHAAEIKEMAQQAPQGQKQQAFQDALNEQSRQLGDRTVYKHYFHTIHPLSFLLLFLGSVILTVGQNYSTVWVGTWAADDLGRSTAFYIGIYALLRVLQLLSITGTVTLVLIIVVKNTGKELHQAAITTVLRAPIAFFTSTDIGVVLNLFSQDTTIIDSELPLSLINVVLQIASLIGTAVVTALASPYLAISYPFIGVLLWVIQKFYLRTSKQLRLLYLEAKSPLYANFIDTIRGVATIRAFNWVEREVAANTSLLDDSQRPAYLHGMAQEWLTLVMNLIVAILATVLAALATQLRTGSGFTGASLVTLLVIGSYTANLIRFYTELETSIGAVGRLKTFSEQVEAEDKPGEDIVPDESWPGQGSIEMKNLSASYDSPEEEQTSPRLVLRDVSLSFKGGSKVAICGRTGSGKSSFILVLLRLLDPIASNDLVFTIDGISMQTVDRSALRNRVIAVPQDCVFLPDGSSIKANVDPMNGATDAECLSVLEVVQLGHLVPEGRDGVHSGMSGDQLSAGQRQLFSLARAILRARIRQRGRDQKMGGIVLLDEVSSGVDRETEAAMMAMIQREFASYTVISIAHRLDMVVGFSDTVVVLDRGEVKEVGAPDMLLNRGGPFQALWEAGHQ